jgi:hypothetical protein
MPNSLDIHEIFQHFPKIIFYTGVKHLQKIQLKETPNASNQTHGEVKLHPEDGGSKLLRNLGILTQHYTEL